MRKLIFFIISGISVWWYLYKHGNIDAKGLKRFVLSIKLVIIIIIALLGLPLTASAKNGSRMADAYVPVFQPHIEKRGITHGLLSGNQKQETSLNPDLSESSDSESSLPNQVCKPCEKQNELEYPY